jgi:hypothetical protein
MNSNPIIHEAEQIATILQRTLKPETDGKQAILELKADDYQWKQMEWIGWYYENVIFKLLIKHIGGSKGPQYGRTTFDYFRNHVWDIKAHPILNADGSFNEPMVLNDREAIEKCIEEHSGLGFIVINGHADFDASGDFKAWHDALKGGVSHYEKERIKRGAKSRTRKIKFTVKNIDILFFNKISVLNDGIEQKWLSFFQEGMRNADGSPRRAKYAIWTQRIPIDIKIVSSMGLSSIDTATKQTHLFSDGE